MIPCSRMDSTSSCRDSGLKSLRGWKGLLWIWSSARRRTVSPAAGSGAAAPRAVAALLIPAVPGARGWINAPKPRPRAIFAIGHAYRKFGGGRRLNVERVAGGGWRVAGGGPHARSAKPQREEKGYRWQARMAVAEDRRPVRRSQPGGAVRHSEEASVRPPDVCDRGRGTGRS